MTNTERTLFSQWRRWVPLLAITLFAFALRWYYVSTALVLNPVRGDATQYFSYAWNLANHGVFARDAAGATMLHPDNYRDPGYPVFLAFWMKLLGDGAAWYAAVLLCQAFLGALTAALTVQLGRYWLPVRWAYASGMLFAVWPHTIAINGFLLSETLFGFLCACGLWAIAHACARKSTLWGLAAGITLGAAALTNAVLLPFAICLAGILAWRKLAPKKLCVALALGACLLPLPWAIRNAATPPPNMGDSSADRAIQNFVQGASPNYHPAYRASFLGSPAAKIVARKQLDQINSDIKLMEMEPLAGTRAIFEKLAEHPWRSAARYLYKKPAELWGWGIVIGQGDIYVYPTQNAPFQTNRAWIALEAACHALNMPLMLLMLASLLIAWRQVRQLSRSGYHPQEAAFISVLCMAGFVTLVYSLLQAEPRYSIPFRSFQMLLAMTALHDIGRWILHKRKVSRLPALPAN